MGKTTRIKFILGLMAKVALEANNARRECFAIPPWADVIGFNMEYIQTSPNYLTLNTIAPSRYAFRSTIAA